MQITGIVCEYNPFHLGHQKQLDEIRRRSGPDCGIVCLMSGNYVQRGHPAIVDKLARAKAAVSCGADLVLELPVTYALSSAEGFAAGGVRILSNLCDTLCFGAENPDAETLMQAARLLLTPAFSESLRVFLDKGLSFPAARANALAQLGVDTALVETPNNILAVEYCKAILAQNAQLTPFPIHRAGSYHDTAPDRENPSATALRQLMEQQASWQELTPEAAALCLENRPLHCRQQGEKAILARLRTMTDAEFEALPYGSEGLWRKLMHASRECATLEDIITATKSKRYTRTRIDRMILCAFLGLTAQDLGTPAPYARVLAFNDTGRAILRRTREEGFFVNIGADTHLPYQAIEHRCTALYGLFAQEPENPKAEALYRIHYAK